jgi:hypothetical protein
MAVVVDVVYCENGFTRKPKLPATSDLLGCDVVTVL